MNITGKRISELDGIRGIAIILVLIWHYFVSVYSFEEGSIGNTIQALFKLSFIGVDLFFVLSGLLIGTLLLRNRTADDYFSAFYIRRVARLLPLYLLVVGLYIAFTLTLENPQNPALRWLLVGKSDAASPIPMWSYLVHAQNFMIAIQNDWGGQWLAPTWSLAVEEQFYLVAPLIIWALPTRFIPLVFGALFFAAPVFRMTIYMLTESALPSYVLLPSRLDAIAIGIIAAYYLQFESVENWLRQNARLLTKSLLWMSMGILAMIACGVQKDTFAMISIGHTFVALVSLNLILVGLYAGTPWVQAILTNRVLTGIGLVSYCIYLIHNPILGLVAYSLGGDLTLTSTVLALIATFVLAAASWRWFEKPIIAYSHRISVRSSALPVVS